jgi:biotin--protein ligase
VGPRELAFFQGKAIGPILAPYNYEDYRGSRAAVLQCFLSEKTPPDEPVTKDIALFLTTVFYNGGGYFEDAALMPPTQILATYENNLPAIIQCSYGQGTVVLSGVHFDYDPALMNAQDPHLKEIIPQLQGHHETTKRLINKIFLTLGFFEA